MDGIDPERYDKESELVGPGAIRYAVDFEFRGARRHGKLPAIAVIRVKRAGPEIARAIGIALKSVRCGLDVAGRLSEHVFAVVLGCSQHAGPSMAATDVLRLLESAASAAANAGSGDVTARTYWLKPEHATADDWFREATLWHA